MLTLTRKVGAAIMVGHDIKVIVKGIDASGQVIIGISAPEEIFIHRLEVYERIKSENAAAAQVVEPVNGPIELPQLSTLARVRSESIPNALAFKRRPPKFKPKRANMQGPTIAG